MEEAHQAFAAQQNVSVALALGAPCSQTLYPAPAPPVPNTARVKISLALSCVLSAACS